MAAPLSALPLPGVLRYALVTPTARYRPTVGHGVRVRAGDAIASGLHAAASGSVELSADAIVVHVDGRDDRAPPLRADDLLERVRHAGVVGLGGSGFPAWQKLREAREKP